MKRFWWIAGVVVLIGLGGLGVVVLGLFGGAGGPSTDRLALGRQVYDDQCAVCHGAALEGEPDWRRRRADGTLPAPPHDESGHTWHHADAQLFEITKQGIAAFAPPGYKTTMTGYAEVLSDEEIWAVLGYIKSQWPEELRARQADTTRRAGS
jgi:mono/diheme cytochrome c family protein